MHDSEFHQFAARHYRICAEALASTASAHGCRFDKATALLLSESYRRMAELSLQMAEEYDRKRELRRRSIQALRGA
jgi:hypothetical protein